MSVRFPLVGEPLAIDLANTAVARRGRVSDLLAEPEAAAAWLAVQAHRLPAPLPAAERALEPMRAMRETAWALLEAVTSGGEPPAGAVEALNRALAAAPRHWVVGRAEGGRLERRRRELAPDPVAAAMGAVARSLAELVAGERAPLLRRCPGPGCVLYFLATHPRRHWCSSAICGNRVRAARFARRRSGR